MREVCGSFNRDLTAMTMTITFTPRPLSTSNITTSYTTRTNSYQRLLLTPGPGGNFISIRNIGLTLINDLATVLCWCLFTDQFVIMGNFVSVTMTANSFVTLKTEEVLARFPGVEHPWVWKTEGQFIRVPTVTISHFSNFFCYNFLIRRLIDNTISDRAFPPVMDARYWLIYVRGSIFMRYITLAARSQHNPRSQGYDRCSLMEWEKKPDINCNVVIEWKLTTILFCTKFRHEIIFVRQLVLGRKENWIFVTK